MRAKDLINYAILPLKPSDDIEKVHTYMSEFHVDELPIVESDDFLGFFNESLLLGNITDAEKVQGYQLINIGSHVNEHEHYYELLKVACETGSNLVAVLDDDKKYMGAVAIENVVKVFSKMSSIRSLGTIIVLSMAQSDYSMAEISRIIESEGGRILSNFVEEKEGESHKIRITIKVNLESGSGIISSLERFGYTIEAVFGKGDEDLQEGERLDTLFRYLKI